MSNAGKQRIQVDLTPAQHEALKRVQEHLDCASFSEVFRRGLVVMDRIVDREKSGEYQFGFVNKDNEFQQVWFI